MLGPKRKDDFQPYWQDEKDRLCIVESLPTDNPEARLFAADIIGWLVGYANLTNARSLVLLGDPDASAYEFLFSFSSQETTEFPNLVRSNEDMGNEYIIEAVAQIVAQERAYTARSLPSFGQQNPEPAAVAA
jgi:hypothetical protein